NDHGTQPPPRPPIKPAFPRYSNCRPTPSNLHPAPARRDEGAVGRQTRRGVECVDAFGQAIEAADGSTRLRYPGITLGTENDVDERALARSQRMLAHVLRERALSEREHQLGEVAADTRQRHLGLGVTEARVVFEHLEAVARAYEAREDHATERRATRDEGARDRRDE